jgi:hypothetical protein
MQRSKNGYLLLRRFASLVINDSQEIAGRAPLARNDKDYQSLGLNKS